MRISDIGEPYNVGNLSKEDLSKKGEPCILYGELFTTYNCVIQEITSRTGKTDNATYSKCGDLLFPASTTVDALSLIAPSAINIDGVILGGDMFGIHISQEYNSNYLSYFFNYIAKTKLAKYAKGSTIIHLHYSDIKDEVIYLPCKSEQDKISKILQHIEDKIQIEEQICLNYSTLKIYLLQQMFI